MSHLGERLTALVDEELGHSERDRVLAHLAGCAECRAEAETMRRLKRRIGGLSDPAPSGDLMVALFSLSDPGEPLPPPPPRTLPIARRAIDPETLGAQRSLRSVSASGPSAPGRSLPPAAAAAAFLGLTGSEPLGSRPFGGGLLGHGAGGLTAVRHPGLRHRARTAVVGAAAAAALAVGTVFFVGGDDGQAPPVTPPIDVYAAEHANTTGDVVLTGNPSRRGTSVDPALSGPSAPGGYLAPVPSQSEP